MGVKRSPRKHLPEERGLTDRSIGASKGKRVCIHTDPYGGGERSGKRAKPDALSATANARARTPTPSSGALPSNVLPSAPSRVLPTPNAPPPFNMSCPATALPSPNTIPPPQCAPFRCAHPCFRSRLGRTGPPSGPQAPACGCVRTSTARSPSRRAGPHSRGQFSQSHKMIRLDFYIFDVVYL